MPQRLVLIVEDADLHLLETLVGAGFWWRQRLGVTHTRLAPLLAACDMLLATLVLLRLRDRRSHDTIDSSVKAAAAIRQLRLIRRPDRGQFPLVASFARLFPFSFDDLTQPLRAERQSAHTQQIPAGLIKILPDGHQTAQLPGAGRHVRSLNTHQGVRRIGPARLLAPKVFASQPHFTAGGEYVQSACSLALGLGLARRGKKPPVRRHPTSLARSARTPGP